MNSNAWKCPWRQSWGRWSWQTVTCGNTVTVFKIYLKGRPPILGTCSLTNGLWESGSSELTLCARGALVTNERPASMLGGSGFYIRTTPAPPGEVLCSGGPEALLITPLQLPQEATGTFRGNISLCHTPALGLPNREGARTSTLHRVGLRVLSLAYFFGN